MTPLPLDTFDLEVDEVQERLRRACALGRPRFPWPDLDADAWRAWGAEFARATRAVLGTGARTVVLEGPDDPEALSVAAYTSGLGPLLGFWIEAGSLAARRAADADILTLHLAHGRRRAAASRRVLDQAMDLLERAGVAATVLKGAHTGAVYFPEPGTRPAADVDLLVPAGEFEAAGAALLRAGYRPGPSQRRPRKADWSPPDTASLPRSLHVAHAEDPLSVELHASLERDFFGVRVVGLPADTPRETRAEVHDRAQVLRPEDLAAYLTLHASQELHHLQLLKLVELALVFRAPAQAGGASQRAVSEILRTAGALAFALPALALTEKLVPGTVAPSLLREARTAAPDRMVRYLATVEPHETQRLDGVAVDERLIWADGVGDLIRRLLAFVRPLRSRGSARPPLQTWRHRLLGLLRGRVRMRAESGRRLR